MARNVTRWALLSLLGGALLAAPVLATEPPTPAGTELLVPEPPAAETPAAEPTAPSGIPGMTPEPAERDEGVATDTSFPPPLPAALVMASGRQELHLLGYGHFRRLIWDVFDISLWIAGDQWSFNEPFALELRYLRDVKGAEIVEGTRDQWEHLDYPSSMTEPWLGLLTGVFPDVRKGDQLAGIYVPGRPTRFFRNGEPIGTIEDPEFGRAFFSIWLDERTSQPKLRKALLGDGCRAPTTVASATPARACRGATMRAPELQRRGAAQL